jgi:hypothetical protein
MAPEEAPLDEAVSEALGVEDALTAEAASDEPETAIAADAADETDALAEGSFWRSSTTPRF